MEVFFKSVAIFRAYDQDLSPNFLKLVMILAQLRHVPAAERSDETAVEDQQDLLLTFKIGQCHLLAVEIFKSKIRGWGVQLYFSDCCILLFLAATFKYYLTLIKADLCGKMINGSSMLPTNFILITLRLEFQNCRYSSQ